MYLKYKFESISFRIEIRNNSPEFMGCFIEFTNSNIILILYINIITFQYSVSEILTTFCFLTHYWDRNESTTHHNSKYFIVPENHKRNHGNKLSWVGKIFLGIALDATWIKSEKLNGPNFQLQHNAFKDFQGKMNHVRYECINVYGRWKEKFCMIVTRMLMMCVSGGINMQYSCRRPYHYELLKLGQIIDSLFLYVHRKLKGNIIFEPWYK